MNVIDLKELYNEFLLNYDEPSKNKIWTSHKLKFVTFWKERVLNKRTKDLTESEIDEVIRILDKKGKGNKRNDESIALGMIPQGGWRRMFSEIRKDPNLSNQLNSIFNEASISLKTKLINELYTINEGKKNRLTGESGNAINSLLAAYDPFNNLSIVSITDRINLLKLIDPPLSAQYEKYSVGQKIAHSNSDIIIAFKKLGITGNARTLSSFAYSINFKSSWKIKPQPEEHGNPGEEIKVLNNLVGKINSTRHYWLIAPGQQANEWEEFYRKGIMAIGWPIGDLGQFSSQDEVEEKLISIAKEDKDHRVNAQQCFEFSRINIGDIVIAKKGMSEYLGWGVVTEGYSYHPDKVDFQHEIKVVWKRKGNWNGEIQQRKTVGNITNNPKLKSVIKLLNISSDGFELFQNIKASYDPLVLTNYIQLLEDILQACNLTIDNKKIAFTISPPGRLNLIVGNRYYACVTKTKDEYIYNFTTNQELKTSTGPFSGLPLVYYNKTKNWNDLVNNIHSISTALQSELGRIDVSRQLKADNKYFRAFVFGIDKNVTKGIEPLNYPLNTILYGPPGTGKTYHSIKIAAEIIEGKSVPDYSEALAIFNRSLHDQIEFITFHQNYSYEDFIQGIRPDIENNNTLTFEKRDGIFKIIADRAYQNLLDWERKAPTKKDFETVFNEFIKPLAEGDVAEIEVKMKKVSFYITEVGTKSIDFRKKSGRTDHTLSIATLRKMYDAESVFGIQGLSSYYTPLLNKLLSLGENKSKHYTEIKKVNYVIIIDEINRANISRVFGELITLIEPDKRSHGATPLKVKLPSGDHFVVPSNLYIIGTMNTADKSIALLDIALRRRFEFKPMFPLYQIDGATIYNEDILKKINMEIVNLKSQDFQIGHSYFMDDGNLVNRMNNRVIPLLLEYFMNDDKTVRGILEKAGLHVEPHSWPLRITGVRD